MAGPVQIVRRIWESVIGHNEPAAPQVVIHDPVAERAHDLDDPFADDKVQIRIADAIAATGNRKTKNSY
jgi:hypothetical protein